MQVLAQLLFKYGIQLHMLDGYRSYLGGAAMLFTGAGLLVNEVSTGVFDADTTTKALGLMGAGLAVIGHAGKQDKIIAATQVTGGTK
jgi:hypothetical protein